MKGVEQEENDQQYPGHYTTSCLRNFPGTTTSSNNWG